MVWCIREREKNESEGAVALIVSVKDPCRAQVSFLPTFRIEWYSSVYPVRDTLQALECLPHTWHITGTWTLCVCLFTNKVFLWLSVQLVGLCRDKIDVLTQTRVALAATKWRSMYALKSIPTSERPQDFAAVNVFVSLWFQQQQLNNINSSNNNNNNNKATFSDRPVDCPRLLYREYVSASSVPVGIVEYFLRPSRTDPYHARCCHRCLLTVQCPVGWHTKYRGFPQFLQTDRWRRSSITPWALPNIALPAHHSPVVLRSRSKPQTDCSDWSLFLTVPCPSREMPENASNCNVTFPLHILGSSLLSFDPNIRSYITRSFIYWLTD